MHPDVDLVAVGVLMSTRGRGSGESEEEGEAGRQGERGAERGAEGGAEGGAERGAEIGEVTVALYSPRLKKNIGYAMVQMRFAALGASFNVETPFGRARASVAKKPFIGKAG